MRTRILVGVCAGSIIFGGMAYAGYQIDGNVISRQPQMVNATPVPRFELVAAEQAQEFPGDNTSGSSTVVIPSVKNAPTTPANPSQNLFSYPTGKPVMNATPPPPATSNASTNPLTPPVSQPAKAASTSAATPPASNGSGYRSTGLSATTNKTDTTVDETYIPAPTQVPVNLPAQSKADVDQGASTATNTTSNPSNKSSAYYYQPSDQDNSDQSNAYEPQSFADVPVPVENVPVPAPAYLPDNSNGDTMDDNMPPSLSNGSRPKP